MLVAVVILHIILQYNEKLFFEINKTYLGMLMYLANVDDYNDNFPQSATVAAFVDDTTGVTATSKHEIG